MILYMPSQHRFDNRNYRPDRDEYEPVKVAIEAAGFNMNIFARASLRRFRADPDGELERLLPHLRKVDAETPRGRPKRRAGD